jgi:hypothetical protein
MTNPDAKNSFDINLTASYKWIVFRRRAFFTALETTGGLAPMLREMATLGVAMAAAVTAVRGIIVVVAEVKAKARMRQGLQQF